MITVADLLTKVRISSKIPPKQLDDTVLLSIATDILYTRLISQVTTTHGNYYKHEAVAEVSPTNFQYRFPPAAVGGGIIDVQYSTSSDRTDFIEMPMYQIEDKSSLQRKSGFLLNAGGLEIWPRPVCTQYLTVYYLLRPGKLIKSIESAKVVGIDLINGKLELSTIPSAFSTSITIDVMKSSGLSERVVVDAQISDIPSSSEITVSTPSALSTVSVGDTVAQSGFSPFVQLPDEYVDYFVNMICEKLGQITGDATLLAVAGKNVQTSKPDIMNITSPRVRDELPGATVKW